MNFIIGTAGHIDHGKSSLVQALTGTNPDRLPEEKKRGVTIELGFAHLQLTGPDNQDLQIGLVDVPGHADFVNNMVAGVGALDLALIVVAADDGWMPQSEEHLHILSYLGITRAVIALTKIDLSEDAEFAAEFVRDGLAGSAFAECPIIPVSSHTGEGIPELRQVLSEALCAHPPAEDLAVPCLPVDRAFSVKGMGTIVTGTLSRGALRLGDRLVLQPQGLTASVRSLQNHSQTLELARPGMRTAVNIPDVALDSRKEKGVKRGQILTSPEAGDPSLTIDVLLTRLTRKIPNQPATERPIRNGQQVRIHHGSGRSQARVRLLSGELLPGGTTLAQLRFDEPFFTFGNDCLVLRDGSGEATLAGARVLDPHASRRLLGKDFHQKNLRALADKPSPAGFLSFLLEKEKFLPTKPSSQLFPFSNRIFKEAVKELVAKEEIVKVKSGLVLGPWWQTLLKFAQQKVLSYHEKNPDLPGLPLQDLRQSLSRRLPSAELMTEVLAGLHQLEIENETEFLKSASHRTDIPAELAGEADKILATLAQAKLDAPNRKDLGPTPAAQRALAFLIRIGKIVSLDEKTVLDAETVAAASQQITSHLKEHTSATASDLRQILGTSRRIAMPLLEHLDSQNITRRDGDLRFLK